MVEQFIKNASERDIVALIEKLLGTISGIANKQDVVIDLTRLLDSPPRADSLDTATAVQALCELVDYVPEIPVVPDVPTETDNDGDVSEAARILCDTISQSDKEKKYNANNVLRTVILENGHCIPLVPALWDVVSHKKIAMWKEDAKIVKAIKSCIDGKKYVGSVLGKKLLAVSLNHAPGLSNRSAEILVATMIASFCADCRIPFSPEQIACSSAKAGCLKEILENNGVDSISALQELVENVDLCIACDKGNSRKGINSFVKYICGYDGKKN